ncbi:MAG: murein biosynthesis integral membrane protein MurJ [Bdellovibrio sp.]|jgi:putative peptidoglycan lipid II flippase
MNSTPDNPPQQEKPELNQQDRGRQIVVQAVLMALGTLTSRILGLVRESLFAALFSRTVTDAWYVAFRLPNIFRRLFGEGSLSVAFVPVFVETRLDPAGALRSHRLVNGFYTLFFLGLAVLTAIGVIFPEPLLNLLLDENYHAVAGKFDLTVLMARIMFVYIFLVCTYAYFMAILNALGKFGLAAMAPTFFNVCMIMATLIPTTLLQWEGQALAWGVVVGGIVQAAVLIPSLKRNGYWPKFSLAWGDPDVRRVLRGMVPSLLGMGLLQITTLVNMRFASEFGEGPISFINLADRLLELPLSLVSVSIGTALLPTLSRMWTEGRKEQMSEASNYYLRLNLYVCLPAAVGLLMLAEPIVELLFQRGKFTASEALITANVVKIYSALIISTSLVRVFIPAYYAIKNTWLPAVISGVCLVLHIGLAPLLMREYGFYGLNFSSVATSSFNFVLLAIFYRQFVGPFAWGRVLKSSLVFSLMALVMAGGLQVYGPLRELFTGEAGIGFAGKLTSLLLAIFFGAVIYAALSALFKVEEFQTTWETFGSKIRRRLGAKTR